MYLNRYHPITKQYLDTFLANTSPLEPDTFVDVMFTTRKEVPSTAANEIALFDELLDDWSVVPDFLGTTYYLPDGSRHEITDYGVEPPAGAVFNEPDIVKKNRLLSSINSERAKRWRAGFPVLIGGATKWFHSDEFSLTQHLGLKDKARDLLADGGVMTDNITISGQPVYWSTMDGSQVQITAQVAFDIVAAGALNQAMIFAAAQAHEAAINSPETDLTNYPVMAGWPDVFVG